MKEIYFKLENTITDMIIPRGEILTFTKDGAHFVKLTLRAQNEEEQKGRFKSSNAMCEATSTASPNAKVLDTFERIATNSIIPPDDLTTRVSCEYTTPDGLRIHLPSLAEFPPNFQSYINSIQDELWDFTKRCITTLRWKANLPGKHNPYGSRGLSWSFNCDYWHPAPRNWHAIMSVIPNVHISEEMKNQIQVIVNSEESEPIYHDLYREAWEQRGKNGRSALVIGIAAAEIAVKHCISTLVDDSEWLVANLPSPPIIKILKEYIPSLPARNTFNGKVKIPPDKVLKTLEVGINIRNKLSHEGSVNLTDNTVIKILESIRDILWLMDYYSGCKWAFEYLSDETKEDMLKD